jgi:hypothetical protein
VNVTEKPTLEPRRRLAIDDRAGQTPVLPSGIVSGTYSPSHQRGYGIT